MQYQVKIYNNTGFDFGNIPDRAELLGDPILTTETISIVQNRILQSIKIRASYDTIKDADMCMIGDYYYNIVSVNMTSNDIAELELSLNPALTIGINNLEILDGITERHHTSDDEFGKYTEEEPMLVCSKSLVIEHIENYKPTPGNLPVIEATVNVPANSDTTQATTYTDETTQKSIAIPKMVALSDVDCTEFNIENVKNDKIALPIIRGICYYSRIFQKVKDGLQRIRDLGIEQSIISQYSLFTDFINFEAADDGRLVKINGKFQEFYSFDSEPFIYNTDVKNKRVLYGDYNKYCITTTTGNTGNYKPEEIYKKGETVPKIWGLIDPRPSGKPFYRFQYLNGKGPATIYEDPGIEDFLQGAISGSEWPTVPLVFSQKSGNLIDKQIYNSEYDMESAKYQANTLGDYFNILKLGTAPLGGNSVDADSALAGPASSAFSREMERRQIGYNFQKYQLNQSITVPSVEFPFSADLYRDILRNGFIVYRYKPSEYDLKMQDKILNMYGYKHTAIFEKSMMFNRENFNFIKVNNLSISNNVPRWLKQALYEQFSGGLRIWHKTPSESYYNIENPIKEAQNV